MENEMKIEEIGVVETSEEVIRNIWVRIYEGVDDNDVESEDANS